MTKKARHLASIKVLVLEDDYLIARDVAQVLQVAGVSVVGPFADLRGARTALEAQDIDAAILDVKLSDDVSFLFAEDLLERGVPFVFVNGLGENCFPDQLRLLPRIEKPFSLDQIIHWLGNTFSMPAGSPLARHETSSNLLLNCFDESDIARLRPHMVRVNLKRRAVLQRSNRPMERIYFPENAIISMLVGAGDKIAEVGMIGREGVAGFPVSAETDAVPLQFIVQADGDAIAVSTAELFAAVKASMQLASLFYNYQYVLSLQIAYASLANVAFSVEQRLARWLLMYDDRVGQRVFIVHEFLSLMLHVRRPSVTLAIQNLEVTDAIRTERGQIIIRDREKLLISAGVSYGVPEKEQSRLFPTNTSSRASSD